MNYWNQDERNGRKRWKRKPVSVFIGQEKKTVAYGGKKFVFRPERNVGQVEERSAMYGNEFQIVGAAKVNEWRPFADDYVTR